MNGREQRLRETMESMEEDGRRWRRKEVSGLIEDEKDGKGRKREEKVRNRIVDRG